MPNNEKSFEEALERLEEVVKMLEDGQLPLEQALQLFAEGIELVKQCNRKLEAAEKSINELVEGTGGEFTLKKLMDSEG